MWDRVPGRTSAGSQIKCQIECQNTCQIVGWNRISCKKGKRGSSAVRTRASKGIHFGDISGIMPDKNIMSQKCQIMPGRMSMSMSCLCQVECQIECQSICQIECQIEWCQNQLDCQLECQNIWEIDCQNICQIECQIEWCLVKCQKLCPHVCLDMSRWGSLEVK